MKGLTALPLITLACTVMAGASRATARRLAKYMVRYEIREPERADKEGNQRVG